VLAAWAGLGYYARARNLHACAVEIANHHEARFPENYETLLSLPGIGAYTAGAIAAIAFGQAVPAVDGNVERVVSRLYAIDTPLPASRAEIRHHAARLVPADRPGDFAQAMMDLGATICTPRSPKCLLCPLSDACAAYRLGEPALFPRKPAKKTGPVRYGRVYWIVNPHGQVLVRSRPPSGLLGGMTEFPSSSWGEMPVREEAPPFEAAWRAVPGTVGHTFTHFHLELDLVCAHLSTCATPIDGEWAHVSDLDKLALPGVMRKVARLALQHVPPSAG
jgi:A/G-specific adenine glycosylase